MTSTSATTTTKASSLSSEADLIDQKQKQMKDYTEEVNTQVPILLQPIESGKNVRHKHIFFFCF